jgi:hypothetical protein
MLRTLEYPAFRALKSVTRISKFPAWAPETLVESYYRMWQHIDDRKVKKEQPERFTLFMTHEPEVALLGSLLSDKGMESVWAALGRRSAQWNANHEKWRNAPGGNSRLRARVHYAHGFFGFVSGALIGAARASTTTRAKAKAERKKLVMQVQQFKSSLYDAYATGLLSEVRLRDLLDPNGWEGYKAALNIEDEDTDYMKFWFTDYFGDLWDALDRLGDRIEEKRIEPPPQANAALAKHHYFIRHLSGSMQDWFDSPLHDHVATIATIVTGHEFSRDNVCALLRSGGAIRTPRRPFHEG